MIQGLGSLRTPEAAFSPSGNPIWDEIQQAHSTLSPAAQRAVSLSGVPQRAAEAEAVDTPQPEAQTKPLAPIAAPSAMGVRGLGSPSPAVAPAAPVAGPPQASLEAQDHVNELNRVTAAPLPSSSPLAHTKADTGRSGIGQIHNKFVRHGLGILDAVGSAFLPNLTSLIPGTELHHRDVVAQNEGIVNADTERTKNAATTAAETARAGSLANPPKQYKQATKSEIDPAHPELGAQNVWYSESDPTKKYYGNAPVAADPTSPKTAFDLFLRDNPEGTAEDWATYQEKHRPLTNEFEAWAADPANKGKPVADFMKLKAANSTPREGELPLGERVQNINAALLNRFKVLHPEASALPPEYALPANATQKDFDRVDKLLEATERATGTKAQQDSTRAMQQQMHADAKATREQKDETSMRTAVLADHAPAADSAERFNIMTKNYEDAVKNHDQQAMLSLLANHIGMTLGAQKGARITKDIIHEAQESRPWLQGIEAKFDSNGLLSGVTLTPEQMRQMVDLGREKFAEDVSKSRSRSAFRGYAGADPDRTPSPATINHYVHKAKGNAAQAAELMRKDGWTVK